MMLCVTDALIYGHVAGCGGQGCQAFCAAVFQPRYAVPILGANAWSTSNPEMPMIAVNSAYSMRSWPLSSSLNLKIRSLIGTLLVFAGGRRYLPRSADD